MCIIITFIKSYNNLLNLSSTNNDQPKTPLRGDRTPQRTPQHTPSRTPYRNRTPSKSTTTTPNRDSSYARSIFKTPIRTPDFVSLAREEQQELKRHNSFFAYNPEKEPIKVRSCLE